MFVFLVGLKVFYRNKCFGKKILRNKRILSQAIYLGGRGVDGPPLRCNSPMEPLPLVTGIDEWDPYL